MTSLKVCACWIARWVGDQGLGLVK